MDIERENMRFFFMVITLILITVVLFPKFLVVNATDSLQYELTLEKIKDARILEFEGVYYVGIQLKETYKQEFAELTVNNIGRRLEIIFSGRILTSAIIKVKIDSGIINAGEWNSEEDAKRFMEALYKDNDNIETITNDNLQKEQILHPVVIEGREELNRDRDIDWYKTFGGKMSDGANSLRLTSDGGYIIAGNTESFGSGASDVYLIKTDSSGNEEWSKIIGGDMWDRAGSVQETTDGGYLIAGSTRSYGEYGLHDVILLKLVIKLNKKRKLR